MNSRYTSLRGSQETCSFFKWKSASTYVRFLLELSPKAVQSILDLDLVCLFGRDTRHGFTSLPCKVYLAICKFSGFHLCLTHGVIFEQANMFITYGLCGLLVQTVILRALLSGLGEKYVLILGEP